jgi:hypothetical protein
MYDDYLTVRADKTSGLVISADTAMPNSDELLLYKLDAEVLFTSGYKVSSSINIALGDDISPIVMSSSMMYNPINTAYTSQHGSAIGRNNIYKIDLMTLT